MGYYECIGGEENKIDVNPLSGECKKGLTWTANLQGFMQAERVLEVMGKT